MMGALIQEEEAKVRIARRIAKEFSDQKRRMVINLGVGIPTMVADYIESGDVFIQAENGILGLGPLARGDQVDRQLINAGRQPVTEMPGCCYFDSATSFGMIRGGHVDSTVIGAFEVDQEGSLANWIIPNGKALGVGGAMDLVTGAKQVIVAMQHTSKDGKPKLVKSCSLPVTGVRLVHIVVTELALFRFERSGTECRMVLREIASEISIKELRSITEAQFSVHTDLQKMSIFGEEPAIAARSKS